MMESKNPSLLSPSGNNRDKLGTVLPTDQSENVRIDTEVYELTPYRWILLTSFSCAVTASSFVMMTFVPGAGITAVVYDVPPIYVNSCVVLFLVSFIVFNFASISALENLGLAKTFQICAIGQILGVWLRWVTLASFGNFYLLLVP